MKKIVAKLRRNKDMKTYIVVLDNGSKVKVRAKGYEVTYFTGTGKCASLKFTGRKKEGFISPASMAALYEK
ncbi:hypothetical protein SEA_BEUFFERT_246 [Streptomyces phage Beuffert]|nr:hypothetical protein SEA_BEUFFERT_246 [Streptomyces phage Beuffert]